MRAKLGARRHVLLELLEQELGLRDDGAARQHDLEVDARPDRVGLVVLALFCRVEHVGDRMRRRDLREAHVGEDRGGRSRGGLHDVVGRRLEDP